MELKTSFVKAVTYKKEFDGKFGKVHYFNVEMVNGDKGEYASKEKDQKHFVEGVEVTYELHVKDNGYVDFKIPKPANSGGGWSGKGGNRTPSPGSNPEEYKFRQALIVAQSSARLTVEMIIAGKLDSKKFKTMMHRIMKYEFEAANEFKDKIILQNQQQ